MNIGSLFSGIGGLELGLERAGVGRVVWQVEIDPFCRRVLAKHWPNVTRYEDVRTCQPERVDVICGGFPCQDVSSAGARRGLAGHRSGLWFEYLRLVGESHPRVVVVENVASGTKLWLPEVRKGLEGLGYRARAFALSAFDVGAPHLRRRIFVVAYADGVQLRNESGRGRGSRRQGAHVASHHGAPGTARDADREGESTLSEHEEVARLRGVASGASAWTSPPVFRRVDDGLPGRVDKFERQGRIRALGNAVVPQCAEVIGRMIVEQVET